MANMGGFSVSGMKKLQKQLNKIQQNNVEAFVDACAKELAARLLAKVIKNTTVGEYPKSSGKKGGTLRRGWTSKTHADAEDGTGKSSIVAGKAYADSLKIHHFGNMIVIEIINPVKYASYVEYGHRKANQQGWVSGKFVMTIAISKIQDIAPKVLESKIKKFLGECLK